jgi:hypothetical protein
MRRTHALLTSRAGVLAALLVALTFTVVLLAPPPAGACAGYAVETIYYSDASHSTQVGSCYRDCSCNVTCDGVRTSYVTRDYYCCSYNGC